MRDLVIDMDGYIVRSSGSDRTDNTGEKATSEIAVPLAKKPYASPHVVFFGSVPQFTNGATGSVTDGGATRQLKPPV